MVDITYDVADPDSPTLTVYLKVSADGGATWKGPVELVSGDVGRGIVPGGGKRLVWDAGKELPNQYGMKYRYRIGASDQPLTAPVGLALIPAGPFQMGDERVPNATPLHTVTVSAFAMDKWEVSIELWESVRVWGNAHGYDLVAGSSFGAQHPVHSVSWYDAVKWCNARSEKEGRVPAYYEDAALEVVYRSRQKQPDGVNWIVGYRLPTMEEWEKAARGGVVGKLYPWGTDEISPELANYRASRKGKTMPIGSYGANGYGLYDMAGNVSEWGWEQYLYWSDFSRQHRGGSWNDDVFCKVASSYGTVDYDRTPSIGFRCVFYPGQP